MKKRVRLTYIALLCAMFLAQVSCDLGLSVFPTYLTEAALTKNLGNGSFFPNPGAVEYYGLVVSNPMTPPYTDDSVMLLASYYNGDRRQIILNSDLEILWDQEDPRFGTRLFRDSLGYYILGQSRGTYNEVTSILTLDSLQFNNFGRDGYAGRFNNLNVVFERNIFFDGTAYGVRYMDLGSAASNEWLSDPGGATSFVQLPLSGEFDILNIKTLYNVSINGTPQEITVIASRSYDSGISLLQRYIPGFPIWQFPPAGYQVQLGEIVSVVDEGIVCHLRDDNKVHLIGWNYKEIASTNYDGRFREVLVDFGRTGYYYVFDPETRRLFKVRNWWQ